MELLARYSQPALLVSNSSVFEERDFHEVSITPGKKAWMQFSVLDTETTGQYPNLAVDISAWDAYQYVVVECVVEENRIANKPPDCSWDLI